MTEDASRHPREIAADFLRRMRAAPPGVDTAMAEVEAAIEEHRVSHDGIKL
jgi:hypothetical protein